MPGLLIIGAGPGLGASVARRFAREGWHLSLLARRQATLESVARDIAVPDASIALYQADAGQAEELQHTIRTAIAENGLPDVVVYNVGLIRADAPGDLSAEEQTRAWAVNVLGALIAAEQTMPRMAERGGGLFLATSGMPVPVAGYLSLSLGKAGLRALAAMLDDHFGPTSVRAATVTVAGAIAPDTAYDPDRIAEAYWRLYAKPPRDWQTDYLFEESRWTGH